MKTIMLEMVIVFGVLCMLSYLFKRIFNAQWIGKRGEDGTRGMRHVRPLGHESGRRQLRYGRLEGSDDKAQHHQKGEKPLSLS